MPISGNQSAGFDPAQMQQKMQQRLQDADSDGNLSLSKAEAKDAVSGVGMSDSMFEKAFTKMDADGDGEVSQQEQEDMFAEMEARMEKISGGGLFSVGNTGSDSTFQSLLDSLTNSEEDSDKKSEYQKALEQLRENPQSKQAQKQAGDIINRDIPTINTTA